MIKHLHRLFPDPSSLGSFLEFVAFIIDRIAVTAERLIDMLISNHDFPRFAGKTDDQAVRFLRLLTSKNVLINDIAQLIRNAMVYPFINDGYPILYSGQEHNLQGGDDPYNREAIWLFGYDESSVCDSLCSVLHIHSLTNENLSLHTI